MKYRVSGYLTISVTADIEAANEDEAKKKASSLGAPGLCHSCENAGGSAGEWELNGFDDPPEDAVQHVELLTTDEEDE